MEAMVGIEDETNELTDWGFLVPNYTSISRL